MGNAVVTEKRFCFDGQPENDDNAFGELLKDIIRLGLSSASLQATSSPQSNISSSNGGGGVALTVRTCGSIDEIIAHNNNNQLHQDTAYLQRRWMMIPSHVEKALWKKDRVLASARALVSIDLSGVAIKVSSSPNAALSLQGNDDDDYVRRNSSSAGIAGGGGGGSTVVSLSNLQEVHIGDYFLYDCVNLEKVVLPDNIVSIGSFFMASSGTSAKDKMTAVNNNNVFTSRGVGPCKSIGTNFLHGCTALEQVDLRSFVNVSRIGKQFLASCTGVTSVHLDGFASSFSPQQQQQQQQFLLTTIPDGFLSGCTSLKTLPVDFFQSTIFVNVTSIENDFMSHNSSLEEIENFDGLEKVTKVGDKFLCGATALKRIGSLRGLSSVVWDVPAFFASYANEQLLSHDNDAFRGKRFLSSCTALTEFKPSSPSSFATNTEFIPEYFLEMNSSLASIEFPDELPSCTTIREHFAAECTGLKRLDLRGLKHVQRIAGHFCSNCRKLRAVDFSPMSNTLKYIDERLFFECRSLTRVNLEGLQQLVAIDCWCLNGCVSLKSFTLANLPQLKSIGSNFCTFCDKLEIIVLRNLPQLAVIGDNFVIRNKSLKRVVFVDEEDVASVTDSHHHRDGGDDNDNNGGDDDRGGGGVESLGKQRCDGGGRCGFGHLQKIGDNFMMQNPQLDFCDLSPLRQLTSIGAFGFLSETPSLRTVFLPLHLRGCIPGMNERGIPRVAAVMQQQKQQQQDLDNTQHTTVTVTAAAAAASAVSSTTTTTIVSVQSTYFERVRKQALWSMRGRPVLLLREKAPEGSRIREAFQIWNVMVLTGMFL